MSRLSQTGYPNCCTLTGGIPRTKHMYIFLHARRTPLAAPKQRLIFRIGALLPWSGGVCWVFFWPTSEIFAVPPRTPEDAVPSAQRNRGYSLFPLPVLPQARPVHDQWPHCVEWASFGTAIAP